MHYHSTRRVLAGCGRTLPKSPSEDGYVGGRPRSCNGLRPRDLVELSPVAAVTIAISPRCTTTALTGSWPAAVAPCPSLPLKTVTLVVGPGAATASVLAIWSNYRLYQLLRMSSHPVALPQPNPAAVSPRPSTSLKTVTLVVGPGAATASVLTIWSNYRLYQLLLM